MHWQAFCNVRRFIISMLAKDAECYVHPLRDVMADISGAWLGSYWQGDSQTRFEVTFVQAKNTLTGRVLDDGPLGEAQISGDVTGRGISFSKRYVITSIHVIHYSGTISEDETFMSGTWTIKGNGSGRWEARRNSDDLMAELNARLAKQTTLAGVAE